MKLRFSTLFLMVCFSGFALLPATSYSQSVFWGFKGGVNLTKVGGLPVEKNMMGLGYHFGVFGNFLVNDRISFTHELLYSKRMIHVNINDTVSTKNGVGYLEIPWMVNYHMSSAMYFCAGIQPAISTYLKNPINDTLRIYNASNSIPIDFAFILGAGGYLSEKFGMGARINYSVIKAFDIPDSGKQLTLQFFLCYSVNREVRRRSSYNGGGNAR